MTKIGLASDHAGFEKKEKITDFLKEKGYLCKDYGTFSKASVDYPDYAQALTLGLLQQEVEIGILLCGSGNGISIAANRFKGIRAALCWQVEIARLARAHNNANILSLPACFLTDEEALQIVEVFLQTPFEAGRHQRRIEKIEGKITADNNHYPLKRE